MAQITGTNKWHKLLSKTMDNWSLTKSILPRLFFIGISCFEVHQHQDNNFLF